MYVFLFQIDPEGKAAGCPGLRVYDHILSVNDVKVDTHKEAVQLVVNAFYTLKLRVKSPTM